MGVMATSVWFDDDTYQKLVKIAKKNGRSLIGQIRFFLN